MTESLREILQSQAQRIAECCIANISVAPEAVYGFLEASGWRLDLVTGGDYGWTHVDTRTVASDVSEALAESLARYRETANGWPAFCASCWRREGAPNGRGPNQSRIQSEGNTYLSKDFPRMDYIKKATIER